MTLHSLSHSKPHTDTDKTLSLVFQPLAGNQHAVHVNDARIKGASVQNTEPNIIIFPFLLDQDKLIGVEVNEK